MFPSWYPVLVSNHSNRCMHSKCPPMLMPQVYRWFHTRRQWQLLACSHHRLQLLPASWLCHRLELLQHLERTSPRCPRRRPQLKCWRIAKNRNDLRPCTALKSGTSAAYVFASFCRRITCIWFFLSLKCEGSYSGKFSFVFLVSSRTLELSFLSSFKKEQYAEFVFVLSGKEFYYCYY